MIVIGALAIAGFAGTGAAVTVAVAAQPVGMPSPASFGAARTPDPDATPEPGGPSLPVPSAPEPTPLPPSAAPTPEATPVDGGTLAIGITEPNPSLIWPAGAHDAPALFAPWRDAVAELRPHFYRLQLDWAQLQPGPDTPIHAQRDQPGCMRDVLPCAPWRGLDEQLRALAARQAQGGWETVVTISGTPDWAAQAPAGCERPGTAPRSRAPRQDALPAY